jgi:hypothetical protein
MSNFVVMDDEFEVFEVFPYTTITNLEKLHMVYVLRTDYDKNLLPGQETTARAYEQLRKDLPRCMFYMNGKPSVKIQSNLPCKLIRYCTQAVMALPLELLRGQSPLIAECECRTPMYVYASEADVHVEKKMRMYQNDTWKPLEICIRVDLHNPIVVIAFRNSEA